MLRGKDKSLETSEICSKKSIRKIKPLPQESTEKLVYKQTNLFFKERVTMAKCFKVCFTDTQVRKKLCLFFKKRFLKFLSLRDRTRVSTSRKRNQGAVYTDTKEILR